MSYAEEAIHMAKVRLQWAEDGFRKSAHEAANVIKTATPEEVKQLAKSLILDKTVLDDAEQYYNYIIDRYGKEVAQ